MEKTAIVLEALAFLLVIIDLYGESRWVALRERWQRMRATAQRVVELNKKTSGLVNVLKSTRTLALGFGLIALVAIVISMTVFYKAFGSWPLGLCLALFIFVTLLLWYEVSVSVGFNFYLLMTLLVTLVSIPCFLLQKARLGGLLLFSGAVCFLGAKALEFIVLKRGGS